MKKGQLEISFGMIFTIFIIIVIVAVSSYVIVSFQCNSKSISCLSYYDKLQKKITEAWNSDKSNWIYDENVPKGTSYICFGNLSLVSNNADSKTKDIAFELKKVIFNRNKNMFFYPQKSSCCEKENGGATLKNVRDRNFFCLPAIKGKVKLRIIQNFSGGLVSLSE